MAETQTAEAQTQEEREVQSLRVQVATLSEQVDLLTSQQNSLNERKRLYIGMNLTVLQIIGYFENAYQQEHGESLLEQLPGELMDAYRRTLTDMAKPQSQADVRDLLQEGYRQAQEANEEMPFTIDEMQEKLLDSTGVRSIYKMREQLQGLRESLFDNLPDGPIKDMLAKRLRHMTGEDEDEREHENGVQA